MFSESYVVGKQLRATHRSTAMVTRLHYLSDPKHPFIRHSNTSASIQDVLLTANVLPRITSDMADCISIMFIGPQRRISEATPKCVFRIRKDLVLEFLRWLSINNHLYSDDSFLSSTIKVLSVHNSTQIQKISRINNAT